MNNQSSLSGIGNAAFYVIGDSWHHLYHMLPYIQAAVDLPVYFVGVGDYYLQDMQQRFPGLVPTKLTSPEQAAHRFSQHDILYCSNNDALFSYQIKPLMTNRPVMVRFGHGVGNKFAESRRLFTSITLPYDVNVVGGRRNLDMLHAAGLFPPLPPDLPNPLFYGGNDGRMRMLIQGGNPRLAQYLAQRPTREQLLAKWPSLHPHRPTVLFTPTFPAKSPDGRLEPSSIPLFVEMMDRLGGGSRFNILVKLHPHLIYHEDIVRPLLAKYCTNSSLADLFWTDYLPSMDVADLLVCDHTSTVTDFLYFDKPILFLDPAGGCPADLTAIPHNNRYWSYQLGSVLSPGQLDHCDAIMRQALNQDDHREKRRWVKEYSYAQDFTPRQVLAQIASFARRAG